MARVSYKEIAKRTFGSVAIDPESISLRFATRKDGKERLIIKLGGDVMKKAKLAAKDKIDLQVDAEAGKCWIVPDTDGWKLNESGKNGACVFDIPWNSKRLFEFANKTATDVEWKWTAKNGLEFTIPEQPEAE